MKEIIEKILAYLPKFFAETGALFVAPKRFAAAKLREPDPFLDGLVYTAVTIALLALLPLPLYHRKDIWESVVALALQFLLTLGLAAPLCRLIWQVLGAHGRSREFFAIYLYQNALLSIVYSIIVLIAFGFLYMVDAETAKVVAAASKTFNSSLPGEVALRPSVLVFNGIQLLGIIFFFTWQIIAWGAFRQLYGFTRGRSAAALALYFVTLVPSTALAVFAIVALAHMGE